MTLASQIIDILHMMGPGYRANGWNGERRYATIEMDRLNRYRANIVTPAIVIPWSGCTRKAVKIPGMPSRRNAWMMGFEGSKRLKMTWHPCVPWYE